MRTWICKRPVPKPVSLGPEDFGVKSIAENARLRALWRDAIADVGRNPRAKYLREYRAVIESGKTPTAQQARRAFNAVRKNFMTKVRAAEAGGESFPGYSFEKIHHWNWYLRDNALHALDPTNLYPVGGTMHGFLHEVLAAGPGRYVNPVNSLHRLPLGPPRPFSPPPTP